MKQGMLATVTTAALLMCTWSCRQADGGQAEPRAAREAIDEVYRTFEDAFSRGDAETIAAAYSEDAQWFAPETPVVKGRPAIARAWKAIGGTGGNRLQIDIAEVEVAGDRAHEVGRFTIRGPDGDVLSAGKYIVIWARQASGEWKRHRDIFNWDIPPQRP
jgi:uncharacterized protein (TIGR02246 family)